MNISQQNHAVTSVVEVKSRTETAEVFRRPNMQQTKTDFQEKNEKQNLFQQFTGIMLTKGYNDPEEVNSNLVKLI